MTTICLLPETDGSVRVNLRRNAWERRHIAPAAAVLAVHKSVHALMEISDCLHAATAALTARPLRIVFTACAPTDIKGLDHEKEAEAMFPSPTDSAITFIQKAGEHYQRDRGASLVQQAFAGV